MGRRLILHALDGLHLLGGTLRPLWPSGELNESQLGQLSTGEQIEYLRDVIVCGLPLDLQRPRDELIKGETFVL